MDDLAARAERLLLKECLLQVLAPCGTGVPYADDQTDNMAQGEEAMAVFDAWVDTVRPARRREGHDGGRTERAIDRVTVGVRQRDACPKS